MARLIRVVDSAIDFDEALNAVVAPENGAVVTFRGDTRNHSEGKTVQKLFYEAYEPMAKKKLVEVVEEIRRRWSVEDVALAHRLGRLQIGEISLVVAVGSPHRKEAFLACQYAVDRIKQTVPIWKKEFFEGGEVWVEGAGFTGELEKVRRS